MRYPLILQQSEEDCGAACLATVAKFHGRNFSIGRIRELAGTRSRFFDRAFYFSVKAIAINEVELITILIRIATNNNI
jgi:ABC-type bacteriocin/lantibiotic exporter with double-glycine peptidase domain